MDSLSKFSFSFFLAMLFHLLLLALVILGLSVNPDRQVKNQAKAMQASIVDAKQVETASSELKPDNQTAVQKPQAQKEQAKLHQPKKIVAKPQKAVPENLVKSEDAQHLAQEKKKKAAVEQLAEHQMQKELPENSVKKLQDENSVSQIASHIAQKVKASWTRPVSKTRGLSCTIRVKLNPNGVVVSATAISPCSNDQLFKRSAENAVNKASPLPVPSDKALFEEYFKVFKFNFAPE